MRWRGLAFVALLALGGCPGGFTREESLFSADEGAPIFGDRGIIVFPTAIDHPMPVPFERHGAFYEFAWLDAHSLERGLNQPQVQFMPITETPEDDYVVQARLTASTMPGEALFFAFVLRTPRGSIRVLGEPLEVKDEFEPSPSDALCRPNGRSNAECEFESRADLIQYYMTYVRDRLAAVCDPNKCEATVIPETP